MKTVMELREELVEANPELDENEITERLSEAIHNLLIAEGAKLQAGDYLTALEANFDNTIMNMLYLLFGDEERNVIDSFRQAMLADRRVRLYDMLTRRENAKNGLIVAPALDGLRG